MRNLNKFAKVTAVKNPKTLAFRTARNQPIQRISRVASGPGMLASCFFKDVLSHDKELLVEQSSIGQSFINSSQNTDLADNLDETIQLGQSKPLVSRICSPRVK